MSSIELPQPNIGCFVFGITEVLNSAPGDIYSWGKIERAGEKKQ